MGSEKWTDKRFGKRVKDKREDRGWTQAEMAKRLSDKGIHPMHPTTIAKIELGERSVRINEAVGIANLFEVSLDSLLGHPSGPRQHDVTYELRALRDTARKSSQEVWVAMETIREHLEELPATLVGADMVQNRGHEVWSNRLYPAYDSLMAFVGLTEELVRRELGAPGLSQEALMESMESADETQS